MRRVNLHAVEPQAPGVRRGASEGIDRVGDCTIRHRDAHRVSRGRETGGAFGARQTRANACGIMQRADVP